MRDKVCVLFITNGCFENETKNQVLEIMENIPAEEYENIELCIDANSDDEEVGGGLCRAFMVDFVLEHIFDLKKIYTDSIITFSHDVTEIKIFIALMDLFGVEIYTMECNERLYPDAVYLGEIRKEIRAQLGKNPFCIKEATEEQQEYVKKVVLGIVVLMWLEYRK